MQTSLYHSSIHGKDVKILVKYQSFRTSEDPAKPSYRHKTIEIHLIVRTPVYHLDSINIRGT